MRLNSFFRNVVAGAVVSLAAFSAQAADFPSKPITLIIPQPTGGGTDIISRAMLAGIEADGLVPQSFIILNKQGAGGSVGTRAVLNAEPDGYTIGVWHSGLVFGKAMDVVDYDHTAFDMIGQTVEVPMSIAVHERSGIDSLEMLINKARSGPVTFATNFGASPHIVPLLLANEAGVEFRFVQTKGGDGKRAAQLIGGHTDAALISVSGLVRFQEKGVKGLVIFSDERHSKAQDVPTSAELGYKTVFTERIVFFAPKGTPQARLDKLAEMFAATVKSETTQSKMAKFGFNLEFKGQQTVTSILDDLNANVTAVKDQLK